MVLRQKGEGRRQKLDVLHSIVNRYSGQFPIVHYYYLLTVRSTPEFIWSIGSAVEDY